jgi:hypothetical protein
MFKKVALYGLAFGSMAASMVLIQFMNGLYRKPGSFVAAIPMIANLVLPALGVFLFIKSISNMQTDKPINMGKALFGALLVCGITAFCSIVAYQHIMLNRKDITEDIRKFQFAKMEQMYRADTTASATKIESDIKLAKENYEKNMSIASFSRIQLMMYLSTGMVVALLTFLRNSKRPGA